MKKIIMSVMILSIGAHATAIEETRRSCEAGDAKDCKIMGDLTRAGLGVEKDYARAHYYYDKSCFVGNKDACKELAAMDKK